MPEKTTRLTRRFDKTLRLLRPAHPAPMSATCCILTSGAMSDHQNSIDRFGRAWRDRTRRNATEHVENEAKRVRPAMIASPWACGKFASSSDALQAGW